MDKMEKLTQVLKDMEDREELGHHYYALGLRGDEQCILVEDWDTVAHITGLLNGFRGLLNHFSPTKDLDKDKELILKKISEVTEVWQIRRFQEELNAIETNLAFREHLKVNNIENPLKLEDIVEVLFTDEYDMCSECYRNIVCTYADSYGAESNYDAEGCCKCDACK